jgi:thiamine biosynthesis lipoprotein
VGINRPDRGAAFDDVYKALDLTDQAMATSGDYRNFQIIEGQSYSHIIDPRSGYPVQNGVVSTSVIADNCTFADGLATALMVMGPQKAVTLLNQLPGVEGLVVVRAPDNSLHNYYSSGMAQLSKEAQ